MDTIDRLDLLIADGDSGVRRAIDEALELAGTPDLQARVIGALAGFYTTRGRTREALGEVHRALDLAQGPAVFCELTRRKAKVFRERGQLGYSLAVLQQRAFPLAIEVTAREQGALYFDRAVLFRLMGLLERSERDFVRSLAVSDSEFYRVCARTNLAEMASARGDMAAVERHLSSNDVGSGPKTIRSTQQILKGRLLASYGRYDEAALAQREALELMSHRSPVERSLATIELAGWLVRDAQSEQALRLLDTAASLVFELEESQEEIAAAVMMKVIAAKRESAITASLLSHCFDELLATVIPVDQPRRKHDLQCPLW